MKILVFGGNGMLGHKLVRSFQQKFEVWTTLRGRFDTVTKFGMFDAEKTIENIDVAETEAILKAIERSQPDVVINAVGIIKQLPTSKDVVNTLTINSIFPHRLAGLAERFGFRLICISTDCVFEGTKGNYSEDDTPDATDLYGRSKNLGEVTGKNCITLRTSIIGRELESTHSLVEWFLSNRGKYVKGFVNAIYSGFPTVVFADIIENLILEHRDLSGLYHVSSDPINKFELLELIKSKFKLDIEIEPFEDFRIDRSLDSTKFRQVTGFAPQSWEEMIERMARDQTPYDKWRK
jgi:dTDP-4-dehydrorhamnose reductase